MLLPLSDGGDPASNHTGKRLCSRRPTLPSERHAAPGPIHRRGRTDDDGMHGRRVLRNRDDARHGRHCPCAAGRPRPRGYGLSEVRIFSLTLGRLVLRQRSAPRVVVPEFASGLLKAELARFGLAGRALASVRARRGLVATAASCHISCPTCGVADALLSVRPIVAALVAVAMAMFPITGPRLATAAPFAGGHHHVGSQAVQMHGAHVHGTTVAAPCLGDAVDEAIPASAHASTDASDTAGQSCCNMACHFVALSVAPCWSAPALMPATVSAARDDQVRGVFSGRIERPPRTI